MTTQLVLHVRVRPTIHALLQDMFNPERTIGSVNRDNIPEADRTHPFFQHECWTWVGMINDLVRARPDSLSGRQFCQTQAHTGYTILHVYTVCASNAVVPLFLDWLSQYLLGSEGQLLGWTRKVESGETQPLIYREEAEAQAEATVSPAEAPAPTTPNLGQGAMINLECLDLSTRLRIRNALLSRYQPVSDRMRGVTPWQHARIAVVGFADLVDLSLSEEDAQTWIRQSGTYWVSPSTVLGESAAERTPVLAPNSYVDVRTLSTPDKEAIRDAILRDTDNRFYRRCQIGEAQALGVNRDNKYIAYQSLDDFERFYAHTGMLLQSTEEVLRAAHDANQATEPA